MRELVVSAGGEDRPFPVQVGLFLDRDESGRLGVAKTLSAIPALAEAGVTDITLYRLRVPLDVQEATSVIGELVSEFRSAAGREPAPALGP
jgi:hypothetical protein